MGLSPSQGPLPLELLKKYDRPGPRYTSYPTAPEWSTAVGPGEYAEALRDAARSPAEPLSLYIHIPFCEKRCYFCACNVVIPTRKRRPDTYIETLLVEIDRAAEALAERRKVIQLHFGGGTPTFLSVPQFGMILDKLESVFTFIGNAEISIEIDPRVTTDEQLDYLARRGFNRISMGVQDFEPDVQAAISRIQPYEMTEHCIKHARGCGYGGVNIDLIYGLPNQSVRSFTGTIKKALDLRPDRIALYSFAYLPTKMKHHNFIKPADLPELEVKAELFTTAHRLFSTAGYRHIGMDHFALPGDELTIAQESGALHRNFMGYTTRPSRDMIGLGVSAIGYVNGSFVQNFPKLEEYTEAIGAGSFATQRGLMLTGDDLIRQYVISSIMCNFTLSFAEFRKNFGVAFGEYFAEELPELEPFVEDGILLQTTDSLSVTELGKTFVRNVAMTFDAYLRNPATADRPTFSRTI